MQAAHLANGLMWQANSLYAYPEVAEAMARQVASQVDVFSSPTTLSHGTNSPVLSPTATQATVYQYEIASSHASTRSSSTVEVPTVESTEPTPAVSAPPKRKRTNRYKNASPSVLSRRRAQNRASQRAYRARKDQLIHDLERKLNESKEQSEQLARAYAELHAQYIGLKVARSGTLNDGLIWAPVESF